MTNRTANIFLFLACLLFLSIAYLTIHVNSPFGISTLSRALYVDEGFYSDAAQNFIKFGDWGQAYDLRHWPGAPMLTILQTSVFSVFGISITAVRFISVVFALISIISFYLIVRPRLGPSVSLFLSVSAAVTISFSSHARTAIADPVAVGFSMLALVLYLRLSNKHWAIILSLLAAYFAFCSKMYFLFVPVTLVIFWLIDIVVTPLYTKSNVSRLQFFNLLGTIALITSSYILLRFAFNDSFAQFMHINSNKVPNFNVTVLIKQFFITLEHLPFNTKTHVFLSGFGLSALFFAIYMLVKRNWSAVIELAKSWGKEGWVLTVFLSLGLSTIAALNLPDKAHYFYFSILPISFLAVLSLKVFLPGKLFIPVTTIVLVSHLLLQTFYYSQWLTRADNDSVEQANKSMISFIEQEYPASTRGDNIIAIIGQYASQLGLYSNRLMPLDLRWSTKAQLCNRVDYWRPKYFVDFHFPARGSFSQDILSSCEQVSSLEQISRFPVFKKWQDEVQFYRINYVSE